MCKSFTLIELIIVIVIVGILAGFAIPQGAKMLERYRANEARTNLSNIWDAERRYHLENRDPLGDPLYFVCINNPCDLQEIEDALSIIVYGEYFNYSIASFDPTQGYTAIATRKSGTCSGETMAINENGTKTQTGCPLWDGWQ